MKIGKYTNLFSRFDWILFISAVVLVFLGLAAIYSIAIGKEGADFTNFNKQIISLAIGLALLVMASFLDYQFFRRYAVYIYALVFVLLILVLFFGSTIRGTTGWFSYFGVSFQPAELAKFALIAGLSAYFSRNLRESFKFSFVALSFLITAVLAIPIILQPDLGSAAILFSVWFIILLFTKIKKSYILALFVGFVILFLIAWGAFLADYQKQRIMTFVNPEYDPLGRGYNVTQSIVAIGAGQLFGRGLGAGSQSQLKFLPEAHTDFVFAVICEELGLIGASLVIIFFILLFYRSILAARKSRDDFGAFMIIGIASVFFIQFLINIGMNMGILPVTGITLPFLSYGGSSLIISLFMIGVIESVRRRSF